MQLNRRYSNEIQRAQACIEYGTARQPAVRYALGNESIETALSLHGVPLRKEAGSVAPNDASTCPYRKR